MKYIDLRSDTVTRPTPQMRAAMENHIRTVVGRYANNAAVVAWDVANEVIDDSGNMRNS